RLSWSPGIDPADRAELHLGARRGRPLGATAGDDRRGHSPPDTGFEPAVRGAPALARRELRDSSPDRPISLEGGLRRLRLWPVDRLARRERRAARARQGSAPVPPDLRG